MTSDVKPVAWQDTTCRELHPIIRDHQKEDMILSGGRQAERARNYSKALYTDDQIAALQADCATLERTFARIEVEAAVDTSLVHWPLGTRVTKIKGSSWTGHVVGYYSTKLTPVGYCIESENEPGSVQIFPATAIRALQQQNKNANHTNRQ